MAPGGAPYMPQSSSAEGQPVPDQSLAALQPANESTSSQQAVKSNSSSIL